MQIEIPDTEIAKLARLAQAAGFADVKNYVTTYVSALAEQSDAEAAVALLSKDELAQSLVVIDESMRQLDAGQGMSVDEAQQLTLTELQRRFQ